MSTSSSPRSNSSQATLDASLLNRIQNDPPLNQPVPPPNAGTTMLGNTVVLGTNLISLNAYSHIPFKLAKGVKYSSWKSQMTNLLFGYDMLEFVDGLRVHHQQTRNIVYGSGKIVLCFKAFKPHSTMQLVLL
ncbi:hypothetical protein Pint_04673 [Pistacia integerrima]|uniref:Uncharacterized protein n=1 Tax=Pistacia integerrima TaxID=434235 RepID=A0ACC0YZJ3_9ROSI|nr:hypothetical protein Pint_04673 [Pistacia integerrima]